MTTTVRRQASDVEQTFTEHLSLKADAKRLQTRSDNLKKRLKEGFDKLPGVYTNENGSKFFDLTRAIVVAGKTFVGMEMRRTVRTVFDEEAAERVLNRKAKKDTSILEDAQSSYIDQDKIYRLHQEGRITDKELESMFDSSESFAFWPVEGEED